LARADRARARPAHLKINSWLVPLSNQGKRLFLFAFKNNNQNKNMKHPFWRFAFYFNLAVLLISGLAIVLTKAHPVPVVIFFISWLIVLITIKSRINRP
jgi:nucleoside permease NupC